MNLRTHNVLLMLTTCISGGQRFVWGEGNGTLAPPPPLAPLHTFTKLSCVQLTNLVVELKNISEETSEGKLSMSYAYSVLLPEVCMSLWWLLLPPQSIGVWCSVACTIHQCSPQALSAECPPMPSTLVFLWCIIPNVDVVTNSAQTTPIHSVLILSLGRTLLYTWRCTLFSICMSSSFECPGLPSWPWESRVSMYSL